LGQPGPLEAQAQAVAVQAVQAVAVQAV